MSEQATRLCWYRTKAGYNCGKEVLSDWRLGHFQQWSMHHDEYESGPGHWPAAIVVDPSSGKVDVVFAGHVHFGQEKPLFNREESK